jgi:hypothetical protein
MAPRTFVECHRSIKQHDWDDIPVTEQVVFGQNVRYLEPEWFRCTRCHKEKRQIVDIRDGEIVQRYYIDPPGYMKGDLSITGHEARQIYAKIHRQKFGHPTTAAKRGAAEAQAESEGKVRRLHA